MLIGITGSKCGIGYDITKLLRAQGHEVIDVGRVESQIENKLIVHRLRNCDMFINNVHQKKFPTSYYF